MTTFGYIRVSTKDQNIARQLDAMKANGIDDKNLFIEKESGKDFNRTIYQFMLRKIKRGDLLVIKSIDRLGRDYEMIGAEWKKLTTTIGADIRVLDVPLLDTSAKIIAGLEGRLIADLAFQLFCYMAQKERENIRSRQMEGIRAAQARGVRFGRPRKILPANLDDVMNKYCQFEITGKEACSQTGLNKAMFYRCLKENNKKRVSL
jgi:DNA invertase Pin-like site-specific DNA recombinase